MKPWIKIALVLAGYVAAFVIASAVAAAWSAVAQGSDGMVAFGESLLFLGVFAVAAVPATGGALFFLRPYPKFWRVLSIASLCLAATGLAAAIVFAIGRNEMNSALGMWAAVAVLRILIAPLLVGAFALCAAFAPIRPARIAFLCAAAMDVAAIGCWALVGFLSAFLR